MNVDLDYLERLSSRYPNMRLNTLVYRLKVKATTKALRDPGFKAGLLHKIIERLTS